MKLIPEWKCPWKFASFTTSGVGLFVMGAAEFLGATWRELPDEIQDNIPHASTIALGLFGLSMILRLIKFKEEPCDDEVDYEQL